MNVWLTENKGFSTIPYQPGLVLSINIRGIIIFINQMWIFTIQCKLIYHTY